MMTNPIFSYERSGQSVSTVSSVQDTIIKFQADHTGTVSQAKIWIIAIDRFTDDNKFWQDGARFETSGAPVNIGGNTYETQYTLLSTDVNEGEQFYFIVVYYDEAGNITDSFVSSVVLAIGYQDTPALESADITSSLSNYNTAWGNYIDSVPFQRLRASIDIDKSAYDTDVVEGDFDTNFQGVNIFLVVDSVTQETIEILSDFTSLDSRIENIVSSPTNLSWDFIFRPSEDWILKTLELQYEFVFLQGEETTIYQYLQKVDIVETDNTDATPKITSLVATDLLGTQLSNFCDNEQQTFRIESVSIEDGRNQIVVGDNGLLNEDEEYISNSGLTQLNQNAITNNDSVYASFEAHADINLSLIDNLSRVIVVSLPAIPDCGILQENGDFIMQENDDYILQESC